ncbi:MAG TPA: cytochrome C oxidase subunit IV family protein [Kofleriaceae bacterium]|nr:cytochrome C oxidase subunit IV family protein [Kofleriaceae bacterium]
MATSEHGTEHPGGRPYVAALVALLGLTGLSFGLHFAGLGALGPAAALAIAAAKVLVVATVFMHLRQARAATRLIGLVTVLFVTILCLGILADVALR